METQQVGAPDIHVVETTKRSAWKKLWPRQRRAWFGIILIVIVILVTADLLWHAAHQTAPSRQPASAASAQFQKQLPSLKKAVEQNPKSAEARKNYAVALYATGQPDEARVQYEAAVKLNPKDAAAYNNLGNVYRDLHDTDKAIAAYRQAITLNPKSINTYANLANIQLYIISKPNDAIATYQQGLKQLPSNSQLQLLLGIAYEAKGDVAQATQTYQDILQHDPTNAAAKANLTRLKDKS